MDLDKTRFESGTSLNLKLQQLYFVYLENVGSLTHKAVISKIGKSFCFLNFLIRLRNGINRTMIVIIECQEPDSAVKKIYKCDCTLKSYC